MQDNREALNLVGDNKIIKFVSNPVKYYEAKMLEYIKYYEPSNSVQAIYDDLHKSILKDISTLNRLNSGRRNFSPMEYGDRQSLSVLANACCMRAWWNEATLDRNSTGLPKDTNDDRALRLEAFRENFAGELEINRDPNGLFNLMKEFIRKVLFDEKCVKLLASTHNGLSPVINVDKFADIIYRHGIAKYPTLYSSTPNKKEQELIKSAFLEFERQIGDILYICDFVQKDPFTI